jgi:endoglucanase Acf2
MHTCLSCFALPVRSKEAEAEGVKRIYPDVYTPKVVGMLWSLLAQEQTWFGNEEWKSYGIQLLPVTVASEARDDVGWVKEMVNGGVSVALFVS